MVKSLIAQLEMEHPADLVLDFNGIEFASRSFMVQLYSMLAVKRMQARFVNMNEDVEKKYQLAVRAYNKPAAMPQNLERNNVDPEVIHFQASHALLFALES